MSRCEVKLEHECVGSGGPVQGLVEGSLASAFAKRRGEDVRQLVAMMVSIGRSGTVEKLYNAARLAPLQACPCAAMSRSYPRNLGRELTLLVAVQATPPLQLMIHMRCSGCT